ncbi:hypothetical protein DFH09DRAFT_1092093 [Mycena vulgaris]|nr:hypothetical protein DFH09DRAFT_1092093 [Mycena vulgaris]
MPPVTRADGGGLNAVLPTPEKDDTAPIRALVPADGAGYVCLADHKMQLATALGEIRGGGRKNGMDSFALGHTPPQLSHHRAARLVGNSLPLYTKPGLYLFNKSCVLEYLHGPPEGGGVEGGSAGVRNDGTDGADRTAAARDSPKTTLGTVSDDIINRTEFLTLFEAHVTRGSAFDALRGRGTMLSAGSHGGGGTGSSEIGPDSSDGLSQSGLRRQDRGRDHPPPLLRGKRWGI